MDGRHCETPLEKSSTVGVRCTCIHREPTAIFSPAGRQEANRWPRCTDVKHRTAVQASTRQHATRAAVCVTHLACSRNSSRRCSLSVDSWLSSSSRFSCRSSMAVCMSERRRAPLAALSVSTCCKESMMVVPWRELAKAAWRSTCMCKHAFAALQSKPMRKARVHACSSGKHEACAEVRQCLRADCQTCQFACHPTLLRRKFG